MLELVPRIEVLDAIAPQEVAGGLLVSPNIGNVDDYANQKAMLWNAFSHSPEGSLQETVAAHQLAELNFLETSRKLAHPDSVFRTADRSRWVGYFSTAINELIEPPKVSTLGEIVQQELERLDTASGQAAEHTWFFYSSLNDALQKIDPGAESSEPFERLTPEELGVLSEEIVGRFPTWFDYLEQNKQDSYTPTDVQRTFTELLKERTETEPGWGEWEVVIKEGSSVISVSPASKEVKIGEHRASLTHDELVALTAHELIIHAGKTVYGEAISPELGLGIPGFLPTEEMTGVTSEYAVTGILPVKSGDRYLDIAIAQGAIPGFQLDRDRLATLGLYRATAREELTGKILTPDDTAVLEKKAKAHVNRIFRGGDGRMIDGKQAVNTNDSMYYPAKIEDFFARKLRAGVSAEKLIGYVLQGKFDPTNRIVQEYIAQLPGTITV